MTCKFSKVCGIYSDKTPYCKQGGPYCGKYRSLEAQNASTKPQPQPAQQPMHPETSRASFKAVLNETGLSRWGNIFKDGSIPVKSPSLTLVKLDRTNPSANITRAVYFADWGAFTAEQRRLVLEELVQDFKASAADIEQQVKKQGLPIQAKYVSTVPIPWRYVI